MGQPADDGDPESPASSGAPRLTDLRRQMIRKASALGVRARLLRSRGNVVGAARLQEQAEKLRRAARRIRETDG